MKMFKQYHRCQKKDKMCTNQNLDPLKILGEYSFNEPRKIDESEVGSPVQEFFRDAVVLITGGTGFMGKVLLEKLLRTCPHIKHIYLLIRCKKGKNAKQRLDKIFDDRLFKRLKHEVPTYYRKVSAVSGDCSLPGLGLSRESRIILINEVNIIFHGAATVRFNEHIRVAMSINVSGTREVLNLARKIINLKAITHISTAYSNCNRLYIEEKFYDPIVDYEEVLKLVLSQDDETLQVMTSEIIGGLPNTYSFTKSLAEDVIRREARGLPILIFRPTVVLATYREPVRGWIDNMYGPTGIIVGVYTGMLHTYMQDLNYVSDLIPADIVVNALICATAREKKCDAIPIYTCSSSIQKPIKWKDFLELNRRYANNWPSIYSVWYYSFSFTTSSIKHSLKRVFCHIIPGFILDTLASWSGQAPILLRSYKKIDQTQDMLLYFGTRQWTFINDNVLELWNTLDSRDKELFNFDIHQLCWEDFSQAHCLGLRIYLLKDDVHTLPAARIRWRRLYLAHHLLLLLVYGSLVCFGATVIYLLLKTTGFV